MEDAVTGIAELLDGLFTDPVEDTDQRMTDDEGEEAEPMMM